MLHKDYDCKGLGCKKKKKKKERERENSCRDPQVAWGQDELIGGKPPVAK
jgi:hypothetical protein